MVSIKRFGEYFLNESSDIEPQVKRRLEQIELKLVQLFDDTNKSEKTSDAFRQLHLDDIEQSSFAKIEKNVKIIFTDESGFRYDAKFTINLKDSVQALSNEGQEGDAIKTCDVELKRYDENFDERGQVEKKSVEIDSINEDLFEELLIKLQEEFPLPGQGEEFEIETE